MNDKIVLYQDNDRNVVVDVMFQDETFWLTQKMMAQLFDVTKQSISYHLNNIFIENVLDQDSVVKEILTTASDGKKYPTSSYNLDAIIAVGHRVNSKQTTRFRQRG